MQLITVLFLKQDTSQLCTSGKHKPRNPDRARSSLTIDRETGLDAQLETAIAHSLKSACIQRKSQLGFPANLRTTLQALSQECIFRFALCLRFSLALCLCFLGRSLVQKKIATASGDEHNKTNDGSVIGSAPVVAFVYGPRPIGFHSRDSFLSDMHARHETGIDRECKPTNCALSTTHHTHHVSERC